MKRAFCLRVSATAARSATACFSRHPRDLGAGLSEKGRAKNRLTGIRTRARNSRIGCRQYGTWMCSFQGAHMTCHYLAVPGALAASAVGGVAAAIFRAQKRGRGAREGLPPPAPAPGIVRGFIGKRPSRCNFLRASLRARRTASAFSRTLLSEGFS